MRNTNETILSRQVEAVHDLIDELRERIREQNEVIDGLRKEKTDLLEERLQKEKHYNAVVTMADDYERLDGENEQMREERRALREHMQRVLQFTKALQNAYRS